MANGDETFIGAIDQGTSSTRFLIFNSKTQEVVASHQVIWLADMAHVTWVEGSKEQSFRLKSLNTFLAKDGSKSVLMKS